MRLLDTFCGAGGCSMGYHRAGFEVVGVDIEPQPRYPFPFILGDALDILTRLIAGEAIQASDGRWYTLDDFDVLHASPPCQVYGRTKYLANDGHPDLIAEVRELLRRTGRPYIIENVPGAPLVNPTILNGAMFGLYVERVRLFETSFPVPFVLLPQLPPPIKMGRPINDGDVIQPVGHFSGVGYARREMGIDWMTQGELAQAIPPAYTEWIGRRLMEVVGEGLAL